MKPKFFILFLVCFILISDTAFSQRRFPPRRPALRIRQQQMNRPEMLGLVGGKNIKYDNYFAGAFLWLPSGMFWNFAPGFEYNFINSEKNDKNWQFNGDLIFKPRPGGVFYLGGGLAVDYVLPEQGQKTTEFGANALAGFQFGGRRSPLKFFVQTRWTFFRDTRFSVMSGINMALR
ncbi:hypothetical protein JXQ31_02205 [candidate division KSB1 bacterium]|nr:hypothetical protein [candidate division KSB1 bacterium]